MGRECDVLEHMCTRSHLWLCARARVRSCVRACVRACVRVCVCVSTGEGDSLHVLPCMQLRLCVRLRVDEDQLAVVDVDDLRRMCALHVLLRSGEPHGKRRPRLGVEAVEGVGQWCESVCVAGGEGEEGGGGP